MNFNEKLENLLKQNENFCDTDGELLKQKIKSLALSFDEELIETLLNNKDTREHFFKEIGEATIFDYRKLIDFIDDKNFLLDSYTKFSNKVGLTVSNKHIKQIDDVVLTFPFKDCILEGGQSKEDEKRKEIFFNETLAKDEINRLLDKKVISNATKYYYENNEVEETSDFTFTRDKAINKARGLDEDTITDNLIIKGNNLLALHSLKSNFAGKVKLIYIDPPYNTGNDGFKYNDSFNHSTWLTFMKNRLEIAKELLKDDGLIFISIDDREHSYLKILCDSIFDKDNFISDIIVQVNKGGRDYLKIAKTHEFILCYQKSDSAEINEIEKEGLVFRYSDKHGDYNIRELRNRNPRFNKANRPNLYYSFYIDESSINESGLCNVSLEEKDGFNTITYPLNSQGKESCWRWGKPKSIQNITSDISTTQVVARQKADGNWNIYEKHRKSKGKIKSVWDDSAVRTEAGTKELGKIIGKDAFAFPKPVELIKRVIQLSMNKEDIVLDFHAGSGTTAQAILELNKKDNGNRKFILIEQMNYIEDITKQRVKKVIENNKQGKFIYFELDKYNQKFIDDLSVATEDNILDIYKEITEKGFLNYDIELKKVEEHFEEFKAFSLEEKQEFLISMLNKNMLYKNLTEIDDADLEVSQRDKELNKSFYNIEDR